MRDRAAQIADRAAIEKFIQEMKFPLTLAFNGLGRLTVVSNALDKTYASSVVSKLYSGPTTIFDVLSRAKVVPSDSITHVEPSLTATRSALPSWFTSARNVPLEP